MAKDPAVLFYTSDFLSETVLMSDEEIGQYIKLLCIQHQKGVLTEKDIKKVCTSEDVIKKFVRKHDGTYVNTRLDEEVERRKAYSESRRNNRKKKKNNDDMNNICSTHDEHMETETETGTETITDTEAKAETGVGAKVNTGASQKSSYAEFVTMTNDEHSSLVEKFGKYKVDKMVEVLNNYKGSSGKKYKSDYSAILNWVAEKVENEHKTQKNDPRFMGMFMPNPNDF